MQNNNDNSAAIGLAFFGAGILFIGAFVLAALALIALLLTIVCCYCLLSGPVVIFGQTITPEEAAAFMMRGIIGAFAVPSFAIFCAVLFGFPFKPGWLGYLLITGYVFGSMVVTYWVEQAKAEAAAQAEQTQLLAPPPPSVPPQTIDGERISPPVQPEAPPFRFASWDDEEALRK